jgi:hypothetical protein
MAPTKSKRTIAVAVTAGTPAAFPCRLSYESEPNDGVAMIKNIASINPTSPTRLATNAFLPAVAALGFSNQNEISRVRAEPHAFPSKERDQQVLAQDKDEHGTREEIEICEEADCSEDRPSYKRGNTHGSTLQ